MRLIMRECPEQELEPADFLEQLQEEIHGWQSAHYLG